MKKAYLYMLVLLSLCVACNSGPHKFNDEQPIQIQEEGFVLLNPIGYSLGEYLCFDLKENQEIIVVSSTTGKLKKRISYDSLQYFIDAAHQNAIMDTLRVIEQTDSILLTSITTGWFSTWSGRPVFVGYINYSAYREGIESESMESTANILTYFNNDFSPEETFLLHASSAGIEDRNNSFPYYPNAYVSGGIINNVLYIPNYHLNPLPLLDSEVAFSRWELNNSFIMPLKSTGKLSHFIENNVTQNAEDIGFFWGTAFALPNKDLHKTLLLSEDGFGEVLEEKEKIQLSTKHILVHINNHSPAFIWLDIGGDKRSYLSSKDLKSQTFQNISPPQGYTIEQILVTNNDSNEHPCYLLSKDEKFYIWQSL